MAYAAVVSLAQVLKQLLSADPFPRNTTVFVLQRPLIKTLHRKLCSLRSNLRDLKILPVSKSLWSTIDELETRIRGTIYKAQDAIEYLIILQSTTPEDASSAAASLIPFLQELIADIHSIKKTVREIQVSIEVAAVRGDLSSSENARVPPDTKISDDEIIVGQDEYLERLKGMLRLDHDTATLKVVSIVGMPGIGKTTLAKRIYNDPLIVAHFGTRAWVTVSPGFFGVSDVLSSLVGDASKIIRYTNRELKMLFSGRYLVVIDNIWEIDIWNELKKALPDGKNGSRVIFTTQNATDALRRRDTLRDPFLNDDASWELLRRVVFEEEEELNYCPSPELERVGRKIANNCEGHPMAIIEVGKLLRGTEQTVANWKAVEENENPLIISANEDTPLSKALTPSYKSLPLPLKACFLYMGMLPRNTEIRTSKLIRLWVSEGFTEEQKRWDLGERPYIMKGSDLVDPCRHNNGIDDDSVVLENLLTLSGVSAHSCVRGVLSRMPNLTKIGIRMVVVQSPTHIDTTFSFFGNFTETLFGQDFESFKCVVVNPSLGVVPPSFCPYFYLYIRKMTLSGCGFLWEDMSDISRLPLLEVLKLRKYAFRGEMWETDWDEFENLRYLLLEDLDVQRLNGRFPELVRLTIRHCYKLLEIDPHLIDVSLLDRIEVDDCSPATEIWARQIGEDSKLQGRVHIHSSRDAKNKA